MNLKELKSMIAEEYRYWMAEQPVDMGVPGAPGAPGIEVGPDDIDVMDGGDDSESTLRQIYDMLKAYFEGEEAAAPAPVGDTGGEDMDMDMEAGDVDDDGDDDGDDDEDDKKEGKKGKKEDKEDKKELKERFQKLANIIKG